MGAMSWVCTWNFFMGKKGTIFKEGGTWIASLYRHRLQNRRVGPPTPMEEHYWIPVFTLNCDFPDASPGGPAPACAKCDCSESRMNEPSLCAGHCLLSLTYHTNFLTSTFPLGCGFKSSGWCNKLCWVRLLHQRKQFIVLRLEGTITIILLVMH